MIEVTAGRRWLAAAGLLLGGMGLTAVAQDGQAVSQPQQAPRIGVPGGGQQGPTGTVTGRVLCGDTQRPGRFAQVQLQSVQAAAQAAAGGIGTGGGFGGFGGGAGARTGADGTFVVTGVAPGDYYVTANAPGYIPERLLLEAEEAAGEDTATLLGRIPQVHVAADGQASVTVTMQRGAAIAGRVQWEDGSPASGVQMSATLNAPQQLPSAVGRIQSPRSFQGTTTDDRGMFRLMGLPAGDYVLQATVMADSPGGGGRGGRGFNTPRIIQVYGSGVFKKSDAKPISVRRGEDRTDARMVIDLNSLRTVGGHVGSSAGAVASGNVTLTDPNDSSVNLRGRVQADGSFNITYVPPGTYTLQISGASSQAGFGGGRGRGGDSSTGSSAVSYAAFSQQVVVSSSDLTDLNYNLSPVTQASASQ
jgi:hypothetical protein